MNEDILKYLSNLQIAFIRAVFSIVCLVSVWGVWFLMLYVRTVIRISLEGLNGSEIYVFGGITFILVVTVSLSLKQYRSWKNNELFSIVRDLIYEKIVNEQGDDFNVDSKVDKICKSPFTIAKYLNVLEPFFNAKRLLAVIISIATVLITMIPGCIKGYNILNEQYNRICHTEHEFMSLFDTSKYCWEHLNREDFVINTKQIYELQRFEYGIGESANASILLTVEPDGSISDVTYLTPLQCKQVTLQSVQALLSVHEDVLNASSRGLPLKQVTLPTKNELEVTSQEFFREGVDLTEVSNKNFSFEVMDSEKELADSYLFVLFR